MLQGGDRRSIGGSNQVAATVLRQPERLAELLECLWSADDVVRMRAADAMEEISVQRPDLLRPFAAELLGLAEETTQQELRWHLAQIAPRLQLTLENRKRAVAILRRYLNDRSSIVKTCAIQALTELSCGDVALQVEMAEMLRKFTRNGTAAMKARSRKLLRQLHGNSSR
ncbi:MAG TPA: hypothetical protein VL240_14520 [Candidatus Binatia bacterium]|nr:hypothetical protein [Candidatus Binatia bacterium]